MSSSRTHISRMCRPGSCMDPSVTQSKRSSQALRSNRTGSPRPDTGTGEAWKIPRLCSSGSGNSCSRSQRRCKNFRHTRTHSRTSCKTATTSGSHKQRPPGTTPGQPPLPQTPASSSRSSRVCPNRTYLRQINTHAHIQGALPLNTRVHCVHVAVKPRRN